MLEEPLDDEYKQVFSVDDAMLYYEFLHFMNEKLFENEPVIVSKPDFEFISFAHTEKTFTKLFNSFMGVGSSYTTVGIDWCKGKWLSVEQSPQGLCYKKFNDISSLCSYYNAADAILIDIPIGLPQSKEEAQKRPNKQLADLLGRKRSSVFNVPFRQIAMADTLEEAWNISRQLDAHMQPTGMALRDSVKQVDMFLQSNCTWKNRLLESHPEYAFVLLNGNSPLSYSKLTTKGQLERIRILSQYCDGVQELVDTYLSDVPYRKKIDDLLDALCLTVIAKLGLENDFTSVPTAPYIDRTGLKMQITVANIL